MDALNKRCVSLNSNCLEWIEMRPQVGSIDRLIWGIARNDNCHDKSEVLGQKPARLSLSTRQIPYEPLGLNLDLCYDKLAANPAWAMARPKKVTNSMGQSFSWEANSCSVSKTLHPLWNSKNHYSFWNSPLLRHATFILKNTGFAFRLHSPVLIEYSQIMKKYKTQDLRTCSR
jgi:hypothetical protein